MLAVSPMLVKTMFRVPESPVCRHEGVMVNEAHRELQFGE